MKRRDAISDARSDWRVTSILLLCETGHHPFGLHCSASWVKLRWTMVMCACYAVKQNSSLNLLESTRVCIGQRFRMLWIPVMTLEAAAPMPDCAAWVSELATSWAAFSTGPLTRWMLVIIDEGTCATCKPVTHHIQLIHGLAHINKNIFTRAGCASCSASATRENAKLKLQHFSSKNYPIIRFFFVPLMVQSGLRDSGQQPKFAVSQRNTKGVGVKDWPYPYIQTDRHIPTHLFYEIKVCLLD